jgi:surfactin synthase thioesterase subunit
VELRAALLPGRETRFLEPPVRDVATLTAALSAELATMPPMPTLLFGHSMGAILAFETALALRGSGRAPVRVILSGCAAPATMKGRNRRRAALSDEALIGVLRELGGTPPEVLENTEMLELVLPMLRADFAAVESYVVGPGASIDVPLAIWTGREDADAAPDDVAGWRVHTSSTFELRTFPGDHFYVESARGQLLAAIVEEVARAQR